MNNISCLFLQWDKLKLIEQTLCTVKMLQLYFKTFNRKKNNNKDMGFHIQSFILHTFGSITT